jgi:hypothetical protein
MRHIRVLLPKTDSSDDPNTGWVKIENHPDVLVTNSYVPELYPACPSGLKHAFEKTKEVRGRGGKKEEANPILCVGDPAPDSPYTILRPLKRPSDLLDFRAHKTAPKSDLSLAGLKHRLKKYEDRLEQETEIDSEVIEWVVERDRNAIQEIESALEALEAEWESGKWPREFALRDDAPR